MSVLASAIESTLSRSRVVALPRVVITQRTSMFRIHARSG